MKAIILELRTPGKFEQVSFYEDFYTHYTEEDGATSSRSQTYDKVGTTKQNCILSYQEEGFGEVNHD